ncbi:DUF4399 domain-containing protein [Aromatoleum bremense]|uniref:DUF4399 domain-containing protein n=1 Tax=Aromatoleum bremense TaxID=76115 RepID=A0ABX1NVV9_9RHOO|nr:DUF4399 domain-containing protein [Aromatoleum bremense]NMG16062.1 DUF4399 domain-containing protein [Aromatoleum bremense]QTQ31933.1 putative protein DUf4399 [Aromatoleum bremense]
MKKILSLAVLAAAAILSPLATAAGRVYFIEPADSAAVPQEFTVKMGVEGIRVQPAGQLAEGSGHHHLIVDGKPIEAGKPVPTDATHLHFGKGQTETTLKLAPGKHTLTLQFADGLHQSYGPGLSATISVQVNSPVAAAPAVLEP